MIKHKQIQEERMRGYFIAATTALLKGEGLRSISVRNVADRAGYSSATLYHYFKDVKDLILVCVTDFLQEGRQFIDAEIGNVAPGIDRIRAVTAAYLKYFIQYPGIFDLFFLEKITDLAHRQPTVSMITGFLDTLCAADWEYCIRQQIVSAADSDKIRKTLKFVTAGLLIYYLNRREPVDYSDFNILVREQLQQILPAS